MSSHQSRTTTNHDEIRRWAEARRAQPACVKGTGGANDVGMIRLDFPGYSGGDSLEPISWDEWFRAFDDNNLALVYQETTSSGERSNFNKLVARETAEARERGDAHASRHHSSSHQGDKSTSTSREHEAAARASSNDEPSLKEREYRDEHGQVHHHTHSYMERHKDDQS